jgi:chaperonin GroES
MRRNRFAAGSSSRIPRKRSPRKRDVKKGDTVLIGKYSGTDIKLDDVEYTILREDEVLAIVEG